MLSVDIRLIIRWVVSMSSYTCSSTGKETVVAVKCFVNGDGFVQELQRMKVE
jgi:hypothetical protein